MSGLSKLKMASCATFSLFAICTTLLIVRQVSLNQSIDQEIQNFTLLKDSTFLSWSQQPNPLQSTFTQNFTLYEVGLNNSQFVTTRTNYTKHFDFTFKCENVSYAQGSSGQLDYINKWELIENPQTNHYGDEKVSTFNLGADKVYNDDFYAPEARKFTITYNTLLQSLSSNFLLKFYSTYLHKFFFENEDLVLTTVFEPLGFSTEQGKKIYKNEKYGWDDLMTFSKWVKIALMEKSNVQFSAQFEEIYLNLNLKQNQILALISDNSALQNMILALNGTMKSKLMSSRYYGYECNDDFCSNQELLAAQISLGFLTSDELFQGLKLDCNTKEFNGTLLGNIEYQDFCNNNPDLTCLDSSSMMSFFSNHYFGDFYNSYMIWSNLDKYDFLENMFQIPGAGESIAKYTVELYKSLVGDSNEKYSWSLTTFNNFEVLIEKQKKLLLTDLYARAFSAKFSDEDCKNYFNGDQVGICKDEQWNFKSLDSIRNYFQAYFYMNQKREIFANVSGMTAISLITFFNEQDSSLFANNLAQIQEIFSQNYNCDGKCNPKELFYRQWGASEIMSNLPTEVFPKKNISILEWDQKNQLNGFVPDYSQVTGQTMEVSECQNILSSETENGLFNLFNLMSLQEKKNDESTKLLSYTSKTVVMMGFQGAVLAQSVEGLFKGQKSPFIDRKKDMDVKTGGSPWLGSEVSLVKLNNKDEIKANEMEQIPKYDRINTGITNPKKLREMSKIFGGKNSTSRPYIIYKGKKQGDKDEIRLTKKYTTQKLVRGTNLLGFNNKVWQGQKLQIFFPWAHQSIRLTNATFSSVKIDGQQSFQQFRYSLALQDDLFIGIQNLNQNHVEIDPKSYITLEILTGLTLEFHIVYRSKMSPLYAQFFVEPNSVTVSETEIFYKRGNLDSIIHINSMFQSKNTELIIEIVLSSVTFLVFLILIVVVYVKVRRAKKTKKDSLLVTVGSETPIQT